MAGEPGAADALAARERALRKREAAVADRELWARNVMADIEDGKRRLHDAVVAVHQRESKAAARTAAVEGEMAAARALRDEAEGLTAKAQALIAEAEAKIARYERKLIQMTHMTM